MFEHLGLSECDGCMVCGKTRVEAAHIVGLTESVSFQLDDTLDFEDLNDPCNGIILCRAHHTEFDSYKCWFTSVTESGAYFTTVSDMTLVAFKNNRHPSIPALRHHADIAVYGNMKAHGEDPVLSSDDDSTEYAGPVSLTADAIQSFNWKHPIRRGDKVLYHNEIFYHQSNGTACYL